MTKLLGGNLALLYCPGEQGWTLFVLFYIWIPISARSFGDSLLPRHVHMYYASEDNIFFL